MKISHFLIAATAAAITSLSLTAPAAAQTAESADDWGDTIFLTFDDGPGGSNTDRILEVLDDNDAQATFFAIGENMQNDPLRTRQVLANGHAMGNHTWSHPDLTELTRLEVDQEIYSAAALLTAFGAEAPCFRPPYGATNAEVDEAIADAGLKKQMWNVDTRDWSRPGVDAIVDELLGATPGDVVLMHDGGGNRSQTVEALEIALPKLAEKGYDFGITPKCTPA
ncbi:polysaccharide deacetylase family protein [Glycomyces sp. L485]|uniref:polysaccharide deacetylase family protein n=1 Tax=Glycomyces sp. L485 TaxID=2909235 RepID=UPI001F4AA54A|nr:polysaccharide deacetylase family protein [Glycomyces sp. L485]